MLSERKFIDVQFKLEAAAMTMIVTSQLAPSSGSEEASRFVDSINNTINKFIIAIDIRDIVRKIQTTNSESN